LNFIGKRGKIKDMKACKNQNDWKFMIRQGALFSSPSLLATAARFFLGTSFFFFLAMVLSGGSALTSTSCSCFFFSTLSARSAARSSLAFALRFTLAAFFRAALPS